MMMVVVMILCSAGNLLGRALSGLRWRCERRAN